MNKYRILTDGHLRVLDKDTKTPYPNIYALGDCATILDNNLPATAQGSQFIHIVCSLYTNV
jgi:NADH dehydrogenase FAD-containing subunit